MRIGAYGCKLGLGLGARAVWRHAPGLRAFSKQKKLDGSEVREDLQRRIDAIPVERYRSFCIVAHIDHGKSTLSDRLLELTGVIDKNGTNKQVLDKLDVERERGITVKAQTCTMIYTHTDEQDYLLNLVDTPGHVDFRHEVSRSYASCSGALLLVDASQGIQAQTVANFQLAADLQLKMVPVINKIDLPHADVPKVTEEILDMFELEDPLEISAKSGKNVAAVLPAIVERIPPPAHVNLAAPLRCLLIDSWFDNYLGVVMLVGVVDGQITRGMRIASAHTGLKYEVKEVGIMHPDKKVMKHLAAGQLGYVVTGMKRSSEAHIGDTFMRSDTPVPPLPGFEEAKPMVFMGAYPGEGAQFDRLEESMEQLTLNDRSVIVERESSNALGQGWRLGFLGTLHASVFQERLQREHGGNLIFTAPTVPYRLVNRRTGEVSMITNPDEFPQFTAGFDMQEPYVLATINCPPDFVGPVVQLCVAHRGQQTDVEFLPNGQVTSRFLVPLAELVDDFFGKLKGATKGYASLDYEDAGYQTSQIVKLELLVNGEPVDSLSRVMHASQADARAREWVTKFRQYLRYQLFEVIIQARCGKKILARETIKAKRKDVLARLHASDISRRKKLLAKQKEGKSRMQSVGRVSIPQEAYQGFLSRD